MKMKKKRQRAISTSADSSAASTKGVEQSANLLTPALGPPAQSANSLKKKKPRSAVMGLLAAIGIRQKRLRMFEDIDAGRVTSLLDLVKKYNLPLPIVKSWLELRELYEKDAAIDKTLNSIRSVNYFDVELQLIDTLTPLFETNVDVTRGDMLQKASRIARRVKIKNFSPSDFWFDCFTTRFFITAKDQSDVLQCRIAALKSRRERVAKTKTRIEFEMRRHSKVKCATASKKVVEAPVMAPEEVYLSEDDGLEFIPETVPATSAQPLPARFCRFCSGNVNTIGGMKIEDLGISKLSGWIAQNIGYVLTPVANDGDFPDSICSKCLNVFVQWMKCFDFSSNKFWDLALINSWGKGFKKEVATQTIIDGSDEEFFTINKEVDDFEDPLGIGVEPQHPAASAPDPLHQLGSNRCPEAPQAMRTEPPLLLTVDSKIAVLETASEEAQDLSADRMSTDNSNVPVIEMDSYRANAVARLENSHETIETTVVSIQRNDIAAKNSKRKIKTEKSTEIKKLKTELEPSKEEVITEMIDPLACPKASKIENKPKTIYLKKEKVLANVKKLEFHCAKCKLYETLVVNSSVYKCAECCELTLEERLLWGHIRRSHPDKMFSCTGHVCRFAAFSQEELDRHYQQQHGVVTNNANVSRPKFHCDNCEFYEKLKDKPDNTIFKCRICCALSDSNEAFDSHLVKFHPNEFFPCMKYAKCGFYTVDLVKLEEHMESCSALPKKKNRRGPKLCMLCCQRSDNWESHLRHNWVCQRKFKFSGKTFFRCEVCGYACRSENDMEKHQKGSHRKVSTYHDVCCACHAECPPKGHGCFK